MEDEYLVTEGVHSTVWSKNNGQMEGLGHVALFDWDDHLSVSEVREFGAIEGPTLVFESSPGNLHGWNLTVRRFPKTAMILEHYCDDHKHQQVGLDRGWWRLRVGEKRRVHDDVYKRSPDWVDLFDGDTGEYVSDAHLELARVCGVPDSVIDGVRSRHEAVGDGTKVVAYATMTDMEKTIRGRMQ